jgi:hypothetical protein
VATPDSFKELLDRDRSKVEARELIEAACPLLRELVNYATYASVRCMRAPDRDRLGFENESLAPAVLYTQLIEQTDGIEVLFSESCVNAAVPALRSAFEAALSLEYILVSDAHYQQRTLAWTCGYLHRRIQKHEGLDASMEHGAKRVKVMEEYFGRAMSAYNSSEAVQNLRSVLARDQFRELEIDYAGRLEKTPWRQPEWFSLLGGPRNRRYLARFLNHEPEYLALYGDWSDITHGTDAALYVLPSDEPGIAAFKPLRFAAALPERAFMAASFMLRSTRLMLQHFRPNEPGLKVWYLRDVKPRYQQLQKLRVQIIE